MSMKKEASNQAWEVINKFFGEPIAANRMPRWPVGLLVLAVCLALGGIAAQAQTSRFAYAANQNSNNIWAYTINQNTGALSAIGSVPAGSFPQSVTVDPSGRFAYVANDSSNNISAYTINSSTGALTAISGSPFPAGSSPRSVTVDPSGRFAYVANFGSPGSTQNDDISAYTINPSTGALTEILPRVAAGRNPRSVTVDPSGRFAYVANFGTNNISAYTINPSSGALTEILPRMPAGDFPISVTVDASGRFAYVANEFSNNISAYRINPSSGALTEILPRLATGTDPVSVTTTAGPPSRPLRMAYTANQASGTVTAYRIPSSPSLPLMIPAGRFPAGGREAASVTTEPSGNFAYVANKNTNVVTALRIDPIAGQLTTIFSFATGGSSPTSVVVDPTGQFLFTTNDGSNNVSAFIIN